MGVIYIPIREQLFYAVKGSGAYKEADGKVSEIHVTDKTEKLILAKSKSYKSKELIDLIEDKKN